ncbi:helix-turn-helix domain-containing protein [Nitratireductor indicus]|uniref:Transcriptional regulator n=1 Tax=Nitratireductor indicus C115 TaxID=1231190 RepID=K2NU59_9HYPH|nr:cupin domain-containing protein [Nitratireductor indicus]EKF42865.1 transcriptional regulator [Nitratireductor indicus C115]MDS1134770.1 cupin domain-containing protein [Nitratireductor indicus]SFQ41477.1 Helix-turn-helix domain-containing protein [Nitratireductor indicus]
MIETSDDRAAGQSNAFQGDETGSEAAARPAGAAWRSNELGARLRQRRKVRGLSLQTVSGRAGVSIGLLSQIERGLTMPSVNSLSAICGALEMPVGWLFDPGGNPHEEYVVRAHQRRVLDLGAKGMRKELMTPDDITDIQMMRLIIQPGGSTGNTPYRHETGAKCGTVLRGALGLEIDGRTVVLHPGDSFAFPASALIRFWCEGDDGTEALWIVTPAVY